MKIDISGYRGKGTMNLVESDMQRKLLDKTFTIKDLDDVSYRTINHWDEKGLLIGKRLKPEGWRKFNFYELIWIRVLVELRDMGISVESISPIILKKLGFVKSKTLANEEFEKLPEKIKEKIDDEFFGEGEWEFARFIFISIISKTPLTIRIFKDGGCDFVRGIPNTASINEEIAKSFKSHISISVSEIMKKFIIDKDFEVVSGLGVLDENELELLKHLRKKEVTEINIKLEDGKPVTLQVKELYAEADTNKRVYEYLFSPYQDISFKTKMGKIVSFVRTTSVKL